MSELNSQITEDLKVAMKAREQETLMVLRSLKAAIKNAAIEKGGADHVLQDAEIVAIIRKAIKQRQDSIQSFESAGRAELAEKEKREQMILEKYLPKALSEEELQSLVADTIQALGASTKAEMGAVMKALQEKTGGAADNRLLSKLVMQRLA